MLSTSLNQKDFAHSIGMSYRTYQDRIVKNESWKMAEIIELSKLNDGQVTVEKDGREYSVTVEEIA